MRTPIAYILVGLLAAGVVGAVLLTRKPTPSVHAAKWLRSDDPEVVGNALRGLTDTEDPAYATTAIPLLKHPDPYVSINAALYLGAVRRPEAVPYLIKAGLRKCEWAYDDARRDLRAITGQDFGTDFQKWREWWEKNNPGASFDFDTDLGR